MVNEFLFNKIIKNEKVKMTANDFSIQVEKQSKSDRCEYIDTVLKLCEVHGIEYSDVGNYITESLKEKLALENGISFIGSTLF